MSHQPQDTASSVGLENSIRQSWSAGSKVRILSSTSKDWVIAHIVTIHKDWLYCLLEDGDTKKIDRWDASVQPVGTGGDGDGEDDEDLFWMKDGFDSTAPTTEVPSGQSMSLGFNTLSTAIVDNFNSRSIVSGTNNLLSPTSSHRESIKNVKTIGNALTFEEKQFQKMCGYTIWVQWCDSIELHGYYQCVGLRNNRYHFKHRGDGLAELFADDKGYWYLMYDSKCLYKSKQKGHDDPPSRNWKCIEGSLPPPGVSQVALPDDSTPMVIYDEKKKKIHDDDDGIISNISEDDDDGTMSNISGISGVSRMTTVRHHQSGLITPITPKNSNNNKKKKKKKSKSSSSSSKSRKNKLNLAKLLQDEFEVAIDCFDFNFDGSKQVAFHLNIGRHMEVTKVKEEGQAQQLGVLQGDILIKINDENISKNWEKATNLLRSHVQNKEKFTITFVRRKVENLIITVVRAGNGEFNGKYKFYKRDLEDDKCPIYIKNDHDEDFDFSDIVDDRKENDDLISSGSDSIHIIQRVYSNPENSEALWVLKNSRDEHYYMCVTTEYLPPQHGWELVPDSNATYPAPGLQFTSSANKFDHVNRLRGYSTKHDVYNNKQQEIDSTDNTVNTVHDALNINNRNRTNKHRHEKTLTRMRATLGSANEFNNAAKSGLHRKPNTGGISGYMPSKPGMGYAVNKMGPKKGGFGSKLFGGIGKKQKKQKQKQQAVVVMEVRRNQSDGGNESAPETDEDSAKIEAIWKQKLEATTKNAINQLTSQHAVEMNKKEDMMGNLNDIITSLRNNCSECSEYYYQLYLEKCELSLILQEKQIELKRNKDKQKEMGKRYFQQQQRTEELQIKLNEISQTFSSRMNAIQSQPKKHRPTKSTVSDLASIEQQFRILLNKDSPNTSSKSNESNESNENNQYLENEMIRLNNKLNENEEQLLLIREENNKLKVDNKTLKNQLIAKQGGSEQFYGERINKLTNKVSLFQQNIYNLMSLLQNVEQEYMQKCGKLPKITKAIDWRNEYDPKKYKLKQSKQSQIINESITNNIDSNGTHPTNQTFIIKKEKKIKKNKSKTKKSKHKQDDNNSATQSMTLPHDQRWAGFNLGGSGDDEYEQNQKKIQPKHRGNKNNESRIIDL